MSRKDIFLINKIKSHKNREQKHLLGLTEDKNFLFGDPGNFIIITEMKKPGQIKFCFQ